MIVKCINNRVARYYAGNHETTSAQAVSVLASSYQSYCQVVVYPREGPKCQVARADALCKEHYKKFTDVQTANSKSKGPYINGFRKEDLVKWKKSDKDIPKGAVGVVNGFLYRPEKFPKIKIDVEFATWKGTIYSDELEKVKSDECSAAVRFAGPSSSMFAGTFSSPCACPSGSKIKGSDPACAQGGTSFKAADLKGKGCRCGS